MASQQNGSGNDGIMSWVIIFGACIGIVGGLAWLVASKYIIYYFSTVFYYLSLPYTILPESIVGTAANDVYAQHTLNRWYPNQTTLGEWLSYVTLTLRPSSILFALTVVVLFLGLCARTKKKVFNKILTPEELSNQMSQVFSEIAPVIKIQSDLVANKLPQWKKQTFPEKFLKQARYQGKKVLVHEPGEDRKLVVDEVRLDGYLKSSKMVLVGTERIRSSRFLGNQIVDIVKDSKNKDVIFPERLSGVGKAVFAILAPYALGGAKGRKQSAEVKDALNYSAYGSPTGAANISIPIVDEVFNQWMKDPTVTRLCKMHHWEYTLLWALLTLAQKFGKIGTFQFIWLKPMDREMFYSLNAVGRATPHAESGLAFSQYQFERKCARSGRLPLSTQGEHVIFTPRVIKAFCEEWEEWRDGDEDDEDWWKEEGLLDWDKNEALMADLFAASTPVYVPNIL